ncbi:unnamed protein product, partial [Prorocentrum cordatum]
VILEEILLEVAAVGVPLGETQDELRLAFKSNYHGEILDPGSMLGQRCWAQVYHVLRSDSSITWTPWAQEISERKRAEILQRKGNFAARSNRELLIQLFLEDTPQVDESSFSAGPWKISQLLQIRRNTLALCGACRLASHKTSDAKLLALYAVQCSLESGLQMVYQLVNEESWSLDDALLKFTTGRQGLGTAVQ